MKHAQFRKESEELESKAITRIMLTLSLTLILSTVLITPTAAAYPFEDIFKKDLLDIAGSTPKIESIYIKSWLDFRPSGSLLAFIRINYISGLSDWEKISLQDSVQRQLESKWYIAIVERNYYYVIQIYPTPPVPWPGFAIGDLNVIFETPISAGINVSPKTLNLKNIDKWITASIKLPEGYNVEDIDVSKILLNYETNLVQSSKVNGKTLKVSFDLSKVIDPSDLQAGEVRLTVTGFLYIGRIFEGSDTIRVK